MTVTVGKIVPDFTATATGGDFHLKAQRGKTVVLYFYPKDNTPGCTTEGSDFAKAHAKFAKAGAVVAGVSRDSLKSHEGFKAKMKFPFELISDPDEKLCRVFGVIREKSLYGRKFMGVDRSTFVFDRSGALRREFRGVKVTGHVAEVLETVKQL